MFQLELVWNREFHFVRYGDAMENLSMAIASAKELENMGDGAAVKKTRIVDIDTEAIVWEYGKLVKSK